MRPVVLIALAAAAAVHAEIHTLTLRQAAGRALTQSPEAMLARLDEQKARLAVDVARDPFLPKIFAGSGLAKTWGFPMSIEGSAPSVVQARAVASVYNRRQKLQLEQAREESRGASIAAGGRRQEAMFRTVELFLEAERHARLAETAEKQVSSARKMEELTGARVAEGRELPLEARRAALESARAAQRVVALRAARDDAAERLAQVLGFGPGDAVHPAVEDRAAPAVPGAEEEAVQQAMAASQEIRRLESAMAARRLQARAERSARMPQLDLVAQYGLFARFNNYDDFFRKFQRNNGQIGLSMQIPLLLGPASKALAAQADTEASRLRIQLDQERGRIAVEARKRYRDLGTAASARQVARLDFDVAREALSVQLARMEEGRATLRQVEEARMVEQEKWMTFLDSEAVLERARYALLEETGGLVAALEPGRAR